MASDEQQLSEQSAARVTGEALGVRVEPRDVKGAPAATQDFDLVFDDGTVLPLEVTRSTDGPHRSFWNEVSRVDWALAGLSMSWSVSVGYKYPSVKDSARGARGDTPRA